MTSNIVRCTVVLETENGAMKSLTQAAWPHNGALRGTEPLEMIISFETVSSAIAADQLLSEGGITAMIMPAPSSIQLGCGFCLRLSPKLLPVAIEKLENGGVQYSGVFSRAEEHSKSVYTPFNKDIVAGGTSVED
jgi:hypothetical protein